MFPCEDSKTVSVCLSVCPSVCLSLRLSVCPHPEKRYHQSYISNWYINGKVFTSTTPWETQKFDFFSSKKFRNWIWLVFWLVLKSWNQHSSEINIQNSKFEFWLLTKSWNHLSFVNISPKLVIDTSMEWSSRVLQHGNPKIWIFLQNSSKFEFWLLVKSWNHLSFVNISPTLVIDTSMEWSFQVLRHGNPEMWKFLKKFEIDEFEFCP